MRNLQLQIASHYLTAPLILLHRYAYLEKIVSATGDANSWNNNKSRHPLCRMYRNIQSAHAISLSPASGNVGSSVSVSGSGLVASHAITATFSGAAVTLSGTTSTDSSGAFAGTTFTVPASTSGAKTVLFLMARILLLQPIL